MGLVVYSLILIGLVNVCSCLVYTLTFNTGEQASSVNGTAFIVIPGRYRYPSGRWTSYRTNGTILGRPTIIEPNTSYMRGVDSRMYVSFIKSPLVLQWFQKDGPHGGEIIVNNITLVSSYQEVPQKGCYYPRNTLPILSAELREFFQEECRKK
jgi:hypothetical protein